MDQLLGKVKDAAAMAGVKHDEGESIEQTMKEEAVERLLKEKVEQVAGTKVASSKQAARVIEKVADAFGDKVPASVLAGATASGAKVNEAGGSANALLGKAMGFLGK